MEQFFFEGKPIHTRQNTPRKKQNRRNVRASAAIFQFQYGVLHPTKHLLLERKALNNVS